MPNIIIPGDNQVFDAIDPYLLAERVPGFAESMDAIKERRVRVEGKGNCVLELPFAAWVALSNLFPNKDELYNHIYPRVWQLKPEYRVGKM